MPYARKSDYQLAIENVVRWRGMADFLACIDCGDRSGKSVWSYSGGSVFQKSGPLLGVVGSPLREWWSGDVSTFHPRCTGCHMKRQGAMR